MCANLLSDAAVPATWVDMDQKLYGARWADNYDEWQAGLMDDEGAVATLASLAGDGPVLEFGVGTGRLAVPLAECGVEIVGVDVSPEMLAKSSEVTIVEAGRRRTPGGRRSSRWKRTG